MIPSRLVPILFCILALTGSEGSTRNTKASIQKYFGSVTWQAGTDAKTIKCLAEDVDVELSMPGKFEWLIGGEIIENDNEPTIDDDSALEHTLNYEPKIEDDGKSVVCRYLTLDDFGDVQNQVESSPLKIMIESNKFPKNPFQAGTYPPGQPIEIKIEFEKYPDPRDDNVVWVVKGTDDKVVELKPGMKAVSGKYKAGDLTSQGNHKFSTLFTIMSPDEDESDKDHYLLIKSADGSRTEQKLDIKFEISSLREPAPTTTTTEGTIEETEEAQQQPAQLNVGIIIILVLVVIIIIVCIGYCIYKKYGQKPEPRQDSQPAKGEYKPAPTDEAGAV